MARIVYNFWLFKIWPLSKFEGITIGTTIYFKRSERDVRPTTLAHEHVHVSQIKEHGCVKFYFLYIWHWFINILKMRNVMKAYYYIPFEMEAYAKGEGIDVKNLFKS
jgi:hypothetical protein